MLAVVNERALGLRVQKRLYAQWNIVVSQRFQRFGVNNGSPVVGHLNGFAVADFRIAHRVREDFGVGIE